jgi:hypothetical protein
MTMSDAYIATYNELRAMGLPPERCELGARAAHPNVIPGVSPAMQAADEARREKTIEHDGDQQMQAMGWFVVRFSRAERTKQTAGIPDRRYYSLRHNVALWWEAKTPTGEQSSAQRDFQAMAESCGEHYVLGTDLMLFEWLVVRKLARWEGMRLVSV